MSDISDLILFLFALTAHLTAVWYGWRNKNWIVLLGISVSYAWLAVHFFLHVINFQPYASDPSLQAQVVRPALIYLFLFSIIYFLNGRINQAIGWLLHRGRRE